MAISGVDALSVAFSSKLYVCVGVKVFAGMVHVTVLPEIWFEPVFARHSVVPRYDPPFVEMCHA